MRPCRLAGRHGAPLELRIPLVGTCRFLSLSPQGSFWLRRSEFPKEATRGWQFSTPGPWCRYPLPLSPLSTEVHNCCMLKCKGKEVEMGTEIIRLHYEIQSCHQSIKISLIFSDLRVALWDLRPPVPPTAWSFELGMLGTGPAISRVPSRWSITKPWPLLIHFIRTFKPAGVSSAFRQFLR